MSGPERLRVVIETTPRKAFATAIDWPGWSRSARSPDAATVSLLAYRDRYAAAVAGSGFAPPVEPVAQVVEELDGGSGTEFGVPSETSEADRAPMDRPEAERRAGITAAAWAAFDRVAAAAPEVLRKGPRGGGRDTSKVRAHVVSSDAAYARQLGIRVREPDPDDAAAIAAMRASMLEVLRPPSDGSPIATRWTPRYAAQRIAWHALDHAWEIEDRSEP